MERMMKKQKAGKGLADAGVICGLWRLAVVKLKNLHCYGTDDEDTAGGKRPSGCWGNLWIVEIGGVCVKLKNLHCYGMDDEDTAGGKRLSGCWGNLWIVEIGGGVVLVIVCSSESCV
jgi:hypothetical protein